MAGQISVNPSKLFVLDDGLKGTVSKLDSVLTENEALIRNTSRQISDVLEVWKERQAQAYERLIAAQENAAREEAAQNREDGTVSGNCHYEEAVRQAEYDRISEMYESVKTISDEFAAAVLLYKGIVGYSRQEYINILQKSSHVLTQYAKLVKKSSSVIPEDTFVRESGFVAGQYENIDSSSADQAASGYGVKSTKESFGLKATKQTWTVESDDSLVFNTPVETGRKLDANQGKVDGFWGTCGLVSCANVLRLAGYPATEKEMVSYASTTLSRDGKTLCTTDSFAENNGATSAEARQQILRHFGIKSELKAASVTNIADAVSEGRGVIISVYGRMLRQGWSIIRDLHAVTVTSVKKDRHGNVLGFYVCDSGTGGIDNSRFYPAVQVENALSGKPMNVTEIIR